MAEAHKFTTLEKAQEVFPELPWAYDGETVFVDNSKTGDRVPVSKGQYIVKIADRYEVQDEAPDNAKTAEAPKATKEEAQAERTAPAVQDNPQVAPEAIGAPAGSEAAAPDAGAATAAPAAE
jgi:hypothetical protein